MAIAGMISRRVIGRFAAIVCSQAVLAIAWPTMYADTGNETSPQPTLHQFVSQPDIGAPVWYTRLCQVESVQSPGYWFAALYHGLDQQKPGDSWVGPHICDSDGGLIWSGSAMFGHWNVFDFKLRLINGQQKMTLLSQHDKKGHILNDNYEVEREVPMVTEKHQIPDMHAFNVLDQGRSALVIDSQPWNGSLDESHELGYVGPCSTQAFQ
jgi:hypothetical protein